jgi:hypothetical protein
MGEEMTTPEQWEDPTGPLKKLAVELRFGEEELQLTEKTYELYYWTERYNVSEQLFRTEDKTNIKERLDDLDDVLLRVRDKYGPALTLQFKSGGVPVLTLNTDYDRAKLDAFYGKFAGSVSLTLEVRIDKQALATYWGLEHTAVIVKLFLYADALVRALSFPLPEIEQGEEALFKDATGQQKVLILVPEHEIELDGEYLAVLGGEAMARWQVYATSTRPNPEGVKFVHTEASEKLRWVQFDLDHLTPHHLNVSWKEPKQGGTGAPPKNAPVALALYGQLFACSLFYMAGHSSLGSGGKGGSNGTAAAAGGAEESPQWVSTFSADKYLTKFDVGDTKKLAEALAEANPEKPWEAALAIAKLATWCYDVPMKRGVAERLSVLQNVVASSMQGNSPSVNCREMARQAVSLYVRAHMRYESFTQKELDKYLTQVKELEDAVEETTKGYNEQVQTLTKSLTDNMLAAVAVVVGSFIAAIFKSPFETNVFLFGTSIYVAYLLVFPVCVGLASAWQRFADSKKSFGKRKREFARMLAETEINQIVGETVTDRESWFRKWFGFTLALYVIVLVLVIVSILTVPSLIKSWGDSFKLNEVSYGESPTSDTVPLIIRGENFNKDKEIIVNVGSYRFTNTDGQTMKVHGTTVLAIMPRQIDLAAITDKSQRLVTVRQGQADAKEIALPEGAAPIPRPVFVSWKRLPAKGGGSLEAYGNNYDSISGISLGGTNWEFKSLDDGKRLEMRVPVTFKEPLASRVLEVTLKNGEKMQATVAINPTKAK